MLSVVILFSWLFSVLGMQAIETLPPNAGVVATIARLGLFVLAPVVALFPTSIAVRPLARVFVPPAATKREDLVGKMCRIRTGTVTDRFGEATLEDGGAGLVVRVRIDGSDKLARGEIDAIAFTSKAQFQRLRKLAKERKVEAELLKGLAMTRVAAVGPVVRAELKAAGIRVDAMPEDSYSMKPLVTALGQLLRAS